MTNWLPYRLRDAPIQSDVKAAGTMERVGVQGRPDAPDASLPSLKAAFTKNEIVFAALRAKADAAKDLILRVEQRTSGDGEWAEIAGHPLRRLMLRPNDRMDGAQLFAACLISWDVTRRVYLEKLYANGNPNGALIGLNPLDPTKVSANRDGTFTWKDGTQRVTFAREQLLIREPVLFDPSPVAVCLGSVDADTAQTDYIRGFFNNAGVPAGVLTSDQALTPDQADDIRSRWRALFGRLLGRQHDVAVLGRGTTYTKMGANLDELQGADLRRFIETRVCMVFGVPPLVIYSFAGLEKATYSNLKEAWASFWDSTLHHQFRDWLSWLTFALAPEFGMVDAVLNERQRLAWDMSNVPALQDDQDAKELRARENFKAGGVTLNEFRAAVGEQPDPAGDYYVRGLALQAIPAGTTTAPADVAKASPRELAVKLLKVAATETIEARMRRETETLLATAYRRYADAVREQG